MDRTSVVSSNLKSVGWAPDDGAIGYGTLEVEFQSGAVHEFQHIPQFVYQELLSAESAGRYFHKNIRGVYPSRKKEPDPSRKEGS